MSIDIKKINDVKIKPIEIPTLPLDNIGGAKFFETLYCNLAIIAKKCSGKSSIIANILEHCVGKNTHVIIFSSTVFKDPTYEAIIKFLDKKKIPHNEFTSIETEEGNILQAMIEELKGDEEMEEKSKVKPEKQGGKKPYIHWGGISEEKRIELEEKKKEKEEEREKKKEQAELKRSKRKIYPNYIFVFDDLGVELRNKALGQLLRVNRHLKCKTIISAHSLTDLQPASRKQLDYCMISRSFNEDKLESLYRDLDISMDYEHFFDLYKYATEKPYSFLYIDTRKEKFREGFSKELTIK